MCMFIDSYTYVQLYVTRRFSYSMETTMITKCRFCCCACVGHTWKKRATFFMQRLPPSCFLGLLGAACEQSPLPMRCPRFLYLHGPSVRKSGGFSWILLLKPLETSFTSINHVRSSLSMYTICRNPLRCQQPLQKDLQNPGANANRIL